MNCLPDFLIIGAQKCGTSWLYRELAFHPQLFLSEKKEIHFFDVGVKMLVPSKEELESYKAYFRNAPEKSIKGEATPCYIFYPNAPKRIYKTIPGVKLIAILRHPADRAFSQWRMVCSKGIVNPKIPFLEAFHRGLPSHAPIRDRGYYAEQLERYFELFPREQIRIFLYDDLIREPATLLKKVYSFLGVDDSFLSNNFQQWHRTSYENFDQVPLKISPDERNLLIEHYKASIERLEIQLGLDLTRWKSS